MCQRTTSKGQRDPRTAAAEGDVEAVSDLIQHQPWYSQWVPPETFVGPEIPRGGNVPT